MEISTSQNNEEDTTMSTPIDNKTMKMDVGTTSGTICIHYIYMYKFSVEI